MESGVTPDFFNKFKKLCKKVLTKNSVCVIIIYVNKKRLEKPTGLQDQLWKGDGDMLFPELRQLIDKRKNRNC